jgi:protein-tyrosine phosphatase
MTDIHCHLLPDVDDGARDWAACIEMARVAVADGIETIVATPHWPGDDQGSSRAERVLDLTGQVQERLRAEGIPLRVLPGHELVILPGIAEALMNGEALGLGRSFAAEDREAGATRYALLETPYQPLPFFVRDLIFQVQSREITPVIAHPERNPTVQTRPETLEEYVEIGCLIQVSAGSILGQFGSTVRRTAHILLRRGWCHVIASDAHSPENRPPLLSGAREAAARIVGPEAAHAAVDATPAALCAGRRVNLAALPQPTSRPGLLRRIFGG